MLQGRCALLSGSRMTVSTAAVKLRVSHHWTQYKWCQVKFAKKGNEWETLIVPSALEVMISLSVLLATQIVLDTQAQITWYARASQHSLVATISSRLYLEKEELWHTFVREHAKVSNLLL